MVPNISVACENVGLSRNTVYRWCHEDPDFKVRLDEAINTGTESVSDLAESKLIAYINDGNLRAIQYWLDNNKRNYARPRPKDFWESIREDNRITEVRITVADPKKDDPDMAKGS
jgi:predicted site-specific integrase-resolvase